MHRWHDQGLSQPWLCHPLATNPFPLSAIPLPPISLAYAVSVFSDKGNQCAQNRSRAHSQGKSGSVYVPVCGSLGPWALGAPQYWETLQALSAAASSLTSFFGFSPASTSRFMVSFLSLSLWVLPVRSCPSSTVDCLPWHLGFSN